MSGGGNNDAKALGKDFSGKLGTYLNTPAPGPSTATTGGANALAALGNSPTYSTAIQNAIQSFGDTASGKNLGVNDPGYQAVRNNLESGIQGDVNSAFGASGRFGSNAHVDTLANSLASGLGALDMQQYNNGLDRQAQATNILQQLQQGAALPAEQQLAGGQVLDQNADPNFNRFAQLLGLYNQSQNSVGFQQEPSVLQQLAGLGLTGAGIFGSVFSPIKLQ